MTEIELSLTLIRGQCKLWLEIKEWLRSDVIPDTYRYSDRRSYINGVIYPASIIFDKKEDATVFVLKFQEAIKYIWNP